MKYRTFRNLVALGGALGLLGACGLCGLTARLTGDSSPQKQRVAESRPAPAPAPVAPQATPADTRRRVDQVVMDFLARQPAATGDKVKDAFPRESFKVNIYRDGGGPNWTRLKIDTDRDEKDDEKWTLSEGQPDRRQVSTRDDERYDREYRWRGGQWVEKK